MGNSKLNTYADDFCLIASGPGTDEVLRKLQTEFHILQGRMEKLNLKINYQKSLVINFTKNTSLTNLVIIREPGYYSRTRINQIFGSDCCFQTELEITHVLCQKKNHSGHK